MIEKWIDKDSFNLLRIPFSIFLMPVFLFALSQVVIINWINTLLAFLILHLFIYPASNGYNSYMDQDEGSIGGLKHPPKATKKLFYLSLIFDCIGIGLGLLISINFFVCLMAYVLASRAYSYKSIRLKKYPYIGFLTVIFFQGAFTFIMSAHAISGLEIENLVQQYLILAVACSLLLAGVYPLTQIYQHEEDAKNGDITISYKLGYRGTFIFCAFSFILTNILFFLYFNASGSFINFLLIQLFLLPPLLYFFYWFRLVWTDIAAANFEHTMRMNLIASLSLSSCFIVLAIINH